MTRYFKIPDTGNTKFTKKDLHNSTTLLTNTANYRDLTTKCHTIKNIRQMEATTDDECM